jgi:hypothetical protein
MLGGDKISGGDTEVVRAVAKGGASSPSSLYPETAGCRLVAALIRRLQDATFDGKARRLRLPQFETGIDSQPQMLSWQDAFAALRAIRMAVEASWVPLGRGECSYGRPVEKWLKVEHMAQGTALCHECLALTPGLVVS